MVGFPFLKDKLLTFRKWNVKYALENQQINRRRTTNSRPIPPSPAVWGSDEGRTQVKRPEKDSESLTATPSFKK